MADDIQDWAIERACSAAMAEHPGAISYPARCAKDNPGYAAINAFARYIQHHEQPPADPVKTIAKALAEKWAPDMVTPLPSARQTSLEAMAEEALRRGLELASQQGDG